MPDTMLSLVESHASQQRTGRVTMLERKTALDALAEIAVQARSGEGRLVLLEGEAGVGQSTLLEQFTHDLPDSRLLSGACDGMFTPGRSVRCSISHSKYTAACTRCAGQTRPGSNSSTRSLPSYASRGHCRSSSSRTCIGPMRPPSICWAFSRDGSARSQCY